MKQPLFYVSNRDRKDQFACATFIIDGGENYAVIKRPLAPNAVKHVAQLPHTYQKLNKLEGLSDLTKVVAYTKTGSDVRADYIKGTSAERMLTDALIKGDAQLILAYLDKVGRVIELLPSKRTNPSLSSEFTNAFGNKYNQVIDCSVIGLVDLNFDNFMVDASGTWHLFDYEWAFEFPLPKQYLFGRILFWTFVMRLQGVIQLLGTRFTAVEIANGIFIPDFIYVPYKSYFSNIAKVLAAELSFQNYAHQYQTTLDKPFGIELYKKPIPRDQAYMTTVSQKKDFLGTATALQTEMQALQTELASVITAKQQLETRLDEIVSSKAYGYARKMQSVKHRLKK